MPVSIYGQSNVVPGNLVLTNIVDKIICFGDVMSINSYYYLNVSSNTDLLYFRALSAGPFCVILSPYAPSRFTGMPLSCARSDVKVQDKRVDNSLSQLI
jgi:hypothetical protein